MSRWLGIVSFLFRVAFFDSRDSTAWVWNFESKVYKTLQFCKYMNAIEKTHSTTRMYYNELTSWVLPRIHYMIAWAHKHTGSVKCEEGHSMRLSSMIATWAVVSIIRSTGSECPDPGFMSGSLEQKLRGAVQIIDYWGCLTRKLRK